MGIKANSLRYRSKRDGEIVAGSEIRAALDELENENSELRAQLADAKKGNAKLRSHSMKCVYALENMLAVHVIEADQTYGTACKIAERAVRAAKEVK